MTRKICVVGLGYIGFPTSLMFAKAGFEVIGVDINEQVVASLQEGRVHLEETGLKEMFEQVRAAHHFKVAGKPERADVFIIAVPTPVNEDHTANLDYVVSATESILPYLKIGDTVIVESTIPPGTTSEIVGPCIQASGWQVGDEIYLAHCPERVLPGSIFKELVENNRIIGGYNRVSGEKAADVYRSFVKGEVHITTAISAEMAKLMENTFRDVNIALANELAKLSENAGIDALEVIRLANRHPRVNIHHPGPGVGGHCIAVDPYFVIEKAPHLTPLMRTAREINNSMPAFVAGLVEKLASPHSGAKIAVFGITYKGNIGDTRESPALEIIHLLERKGYSVWPHDPHAGETDAAIRLHSAAEAVRDADCLIVLADHDEFEVIREQWLNAMRSPIVLDTKSHARLEQGANGRIYNYGNLHELSREEALLAVANAK
ncbi:nucleotide sugar dehydrogenase [Paenibacillus hemerocallicola]|uniref:Nucleotide sugar dehydrogenase n=1 Tax=Paenibacillus hemerocallicola TaxID=1172614 RepID=A0A5C4TC75_9BACL|nr:nucleotide sugar dehydrogenase [Paenibacillus hemerocallicola]TNJ66704.1 nucleotide sugar dehydrogenase [Paenibacillus hemerocallicola]